MEATWNDAKASLERGFVLVVVNYGTVQVSTMNKTYDYRTNKGMLKSIKITTTTTEIINESTFTEEWMDSKYMEILLVLDSEWKTARQMLNQTTDKIRLSITNSELTTFLTMLREKGLADYQKVSNKHRQYRRMDKRNRDAQ